MALIAAHLNAEVILVVTVYSDRYIISLFPHLHTSIVQELCESRGGCPELSVLTSLLVSVDVKNY